MTDHLTQTTITGEEVPILNATPPAGALAPMTFPAPPSTSPVAAYWVARNPWWDGALVQVSINGVEAWLTFQGGYEVIANNQPAIALSLLDAAGEPWKIVLPPRQEIRVTNHVSWGHEYRTRKKEA